MRELFVIKRLKQPGEYVTGGLFRGGQPDYCSSVKKAARYSEEDAEKAILENSNKEEFVIKSLPSRLTGKALEVLAVIIFLLMPWKERYCNYCGSWRVYSYKYSYDEATTGGGGLSSAGATCSRCHNKNWSWRD